MVMHVVALLLLWQTPVIDEAHTLTGGAARIGCWLPVSVTVSSPTPFEGDVAVIAGPIIVARTAKFAAGERRTFVVPALLVSDAARLEVHVRENGQTVTWGRVEETIRILRDTQHLEIAAPPGWRELDPAIFESVDAMDTPDWKPRVRFGVVEVSMVRLIPTDPWIARKRDAAILFVIIYAFAAMVVLFGLLKRPSGMLAIVCALVAFAAIFSGVFFTLFPRGRTTVHAWGAVADGMEYRLHIPSGGPVTYARLAKPVFRSFGDIRPVEVVLDRGCTVIGGDGAITSDVAPPLKPRSSLKVDGAFFRPKFGDGDFWLADEKDPPLTGVSARDLVETRLEPRLLWQGR